MIVSSLISDQCSVGNIVPSPLDREQARVTVSRRSLQEIADAFGDFADMRFECEVTGVEEADDRG